MRVHATFNTMTGDSHTMNKLI